MGTKTLGQQIIDNWGKNEAPECREVTNEVWWKTLQPKLKETIEKHRVYSEKIGKKKLYILVNLRNSVLMGANAKHFTFLVNHEEFPPKECAMLISYDYSTDRDELLWTLPDEASINEIIELPETYDKKLVEDCRKYKSAKRILIPHKPASSRIRVHK